MKRVLRQLRWSIAQRGVMGTLHVMLVRVVRPREVVTHPFDAEFGTDTSGFIGGGSLAGSGTNDRFATAYHGVPPSRWKQAMALWRAAQKGIPLDEVTFLDFGCGKGRALLLASEFGFHEVLGVEMNAGLASVAQKNIERWQQEGRAVSSMRVICGDALEMELPKGRLLVYLYNPFTAEVLRPLLKRLSEHPHEVEVLYITPEERAVLAEFPPFGLVWSERIPLSEEDERAEGSGMDDLCELYRKASSRISG